MEVNWTPALLLRMNAVPEEVQSFVPVNRTVSVPVAVPEAGNVPDAVSKTVVEPVQSKVKPLTVHVFAT